MLFEPSEVSFVKESSLKKIINEKEIPSDLKIIGNIISFTIPFVFIVYILFL